MFKIQLRKLKFVQNLFYQSKHLKYCRKKNPLYYNLQVVFLKFAIHHHLISLLFFIICLYFVKHLFNENIYFTSWLSPLNLLLLIFFYAPFNENKYFSYCLQPPKHLFLKLKYIPNFSQTETQAQTALHPHFLHVLKRFQVRQLKEQQLQQCKASAHAMQEMRGVFASRLRRLPLLQGHEEVWRAGPHEAVVH